MSGTPLDSRQDCAWGGVGAGGAYSWDDGRYSVYGEVVAETGLSSFGDSYTVNGGVGLRLKF